MKKILHAIMLAIPILSLLLHMSCKKVGKILGGPGTCGGNCTYDFPPPYRYIIGDSVFGGKVAYIFQSWDSGYNPTKQTGLIAAISDLSTGAEWGCAGTSINGANSTDLNAGNENTINITAGCTTPGIAARLCADLDLAGFSDWYLPSLEELNKLFVNRALIGGFTNNFYWSSSQRSNDNAWNQNFSSGRQADSSKNKMYSVRAVRIFYF